MAKYNSIKTVVDGITFDSRKESRYYQYLKDLLDKGSISNLKMQVSYELLPAIYGERTEIKHLKKGDKEVVKKYCKQRAVHYVADFVYTDNKTGVEEVVDVKSKITKKKESYILKKKMMLALKGIEIIEV